MDKLLYPLESTSFMNINHVYNKYTISKFDFNNSAITVYPTNIIS